MIGFDIESTLDIELKADAFFTALLYAYNQGLNTYNNSEGKS